MCPNFTFLVSAMYLVTSVKICTKMIEVSSEQSRSQFYITLSKCVFLAHRHFLLFRPQVFSRALGSVARGESARTPLRKCEPWQTSVARALGFKVACLHGEAFRARRAIQARANPRTG